MEKSKIFNTLHKVMTAISTTILTVMLTANNAQADNALVNNARANNIKKVEQGLRSPIHFKGDTTAAILPRMAFYGVPGVSIAVINHFKIDWVKHYGVMDRQSQTPVSENTLFQAASISKPVTAYAALKLAEQNKLHLQQTVNSQLKHWKIPSIKTNAPATTFPITVKQLINHTSGLSVHGFPGYAHTAKLPSLLQVLNGSAPATSLAVLPEGEAGKHFSYSGGGYTVLQQLMTEVSQQDFATLMQRSVLTPLGMVRSTYEQPLPLDKQRFAASGYLPNKQPLPGKSRVFPEMAAAGLWTTAEDVARFTLDVQKGISQNASRVVSQQTAFNMVTPTIAKDIGLGFFLQSNDKGKDKGEDHYFKHDGWNKGFTTRLIGHQSKGYGLVILTNANQRAFVEELTQSIATAYQWHGFLQPTYQPLAISTKEIQRISGRYRHTADMLIKVFTDQDKLYMQYLDSPPNRLYRVGDNTYVRKEQERKITFVKNNLTGLSDFAFVLADGQLDTRKRLSDDEVLPYEHVLAGRYDAAYQGYLQLMAKFRVSQPGELEHIEWGLDRLAANLAQNPQTQAQAVKIYRLNVRLFPESTQARLGLERKGGKP